MYHMYENSRTLKNIFELILNIFYIKAYHLVIMYITNST